MTVIAITLNPSDGAHLPPSLGFSFDQGLGKIMNSVGNTASPWMGYFFLVSDFRLIILPTLYGVWAFPHSAFRGTFLANPFFNPAPPYTVSYIRLLQCKLRKLWAGGTPALHCLDLACTISDCGGPRLSIRW